MYLNNKSLLKRWVIGVDKRYQDNAKAKNKN